MELSYRHRSACRLWCPHHRLRRPGVVSGRPSATGRSPHETEDHSGGGRLRRHGQLRFLPLGLQPPNLLSGGKRGLSTGKWHPVAPNHIAYE